MKQRTFRTIVKLSKPLAFVSIALMLVPYLVPMQLPLGFYLIYGAVTFAGGACFAAIALKTRNMMETLFAALWLAVGGNTIYRVYLALVQ